MLSQVETAPLNSEQRSRLKELEGTIERTLSSFIECGMALREVRDQRLFRESYSSFDDYLAQRWSITRHHALRMIRAVTIAENLLAGPARSEGDAPLPSDLGEATLRPLSRLAPELQQSIWRLACRVSEKPTGRVVSGIVRVVQNAIGNGIGNGIGNTMEQINGSSQPKAQHPQKDVFLPSVYKLAENSFSPQLVINRITDREQAQTCILACGAVIARCREIVSGLKRQYPGIEL
jgi:hypothetical protein